MTQSTGHTSGLHAFSTAVAGHPAPMPTVGLSTLRERYERPPAHVTEHALQLDQELTVQSTISSVGKSDTAADATSVGCVVGVPTLRSI